MKKTVVLLLTFFLFAGYISAQTQVWVSPSGSENTFSAENPGSLEGTSLRQKIIELRNSGEHNIQVILKEGVYSLSTPIDVSNAMAGSSTDTLAFIGMATNPNTNSGKAVLSGGKQVTGWQDAGNGIYKALLPAGIDFRQLYVNEKMAIRARHPNRDNDTNYGPYWKIKYFYNNDNTKMLIDASEVQQWSNMDNVEMVIHQDWAHTRAKVNFFEKQGENAIVSVTGLPGMGWGTTDLLYYWENSLDFLDAEGEWYFDKQTRYLYYKPLANENMNQVEITYPAMDRLFTITGDETTPVQNVYLQNIEFKYGNWAAPNIQGTRFNQGVIPMNGGIYVGTMLRVGNARNVHIVNCNIIGAGGNGIVFDAGVKNSGIIACHLDQIAANGIVIDADENVNVYHGVRPEALLCTDNRIAHNLIENFGMNYVNGYSLLGASVSRLTVEHNEICYSRFSGLHIGNANPIEVLNDNLISANNIHDVVWLHPDGSGIYTTAVMPGTQIAHNWIHDIPRVPWFPDRIKSAVFLDDYSAWITVENNVIQTEGKVGQQSDKGAAINAHGNIIRNNDSQDPAIIAESGPQLPTGVITQTNLDDWNYYLDDKNYYYVYPAHANVFKIASDRVDSVKVEGEAPILLNFYKENTVFYTLDIANVDSIGFIKPVSHHSTAYPDGVPHNPGVVEAENFDKGGEGVAFHDVDGHNGPVYRTDPADAPVDFQAGDHYSNGLAVVSTGDGEWLNYTINAPEAGLYNFTFYVLSAGSKQFKVIIDDVFVAEGVVPHSSWALVSTSVPNVQLSAGVHVFKFYIVEGGFGFDKFEFQKVEEPKLWTLSNNYLTVKFDDGANLLSVLDKRCGKEWSQHPLSETTGQLTVKKVEQNENRLEIKFNGTNELVASVILSDSSSFEIILSGTANSDFSNTSFPGALFSPDNEHYLVATDGEGLLVRVDDNVYPFVLDTKPYCMVGGQSMSWYGMVDTDCKTGYMIILETPDDALFKVYRESGRASFEPYWFPQMGKFGYDRKAVYHFFDDGGYVAQCKKYKEFIYPKNDVRTLSENKVDLPSIDKMVGGVHIYVWDNAREVAFAQYLKDKGIDKAFFLWDPNHFPYPVEGYDNYLKEMGFASGVYDLYRDIHPDEANIYEIVKDPNKKYLARWQHPGEYPHVTMKNSSGGIVGNVFGSSVCPIPAIECVKTRVEFEDAIYPHESHFLDVYMSDGLYECYDNNHRATRTQYKEAIGQIHDKFMDDYHLYCGGEWGADFLGSKIVYAHGMMTLHRTEGGNPGNWDDDRKPSLVLGTHEKTPLYLEYSINENTRVPLFELVYHDAIVTSWRWEDCNHHAPAIWWKKDLFNMLYGTAPLWSIDKESFLPYENQFIESYNNISPWLREIGYDEMLNHRFISGDHKVQRTDFSSGKSIVVNFGTNDYTYDGQVVKAKSYLKLLKLG
jgi:hypothetical protein